MPNIECIEQEIEQEFGPLRVVRRFALFDEGCTLEVPDGAVILTVREMYLDMSDGRKLFVPHLFLMVDPSAPVVKRSFQFYATDEEFYSKGAAYVGTYSCKGDYSHEKDSTIHVFEYPYVEYEFYVDESKGTQHV